MKFRKLILSFLILSIILVQLGDGIILMGFQINKNYISRNLCENRSNPISICSGSCYLKKEIKRNHQKQTTVNTKSFQVIAVLNNLFQFPPRFPLYLKNDFAGQIPGIILQPNPIGLRPPAIRS